MAERGSGGGEGEMPPAPSALKRHTIHHLYPPKKHFNVLLPFTWQSKELGLPILARHRWNPMGGRNELRSRHNLLSSVGGPPSPATTTHHSPAPLCVWWCVCVCVCLSRATLFEGAARSFCVSTCLHNAKVPQQACITQEARVCDNICCH